MMTLTQTHPVKTKRVFIPIIPLNSKVNSKEKNQKALQNMTTKNPLLNDLMAAFDCQVM